MKQLLYALTLLAFLSCAGSQPKPDSPTVKTGWNDEDTYTVSATAINEEKALEQAKHQILKDIVEVRVKNNSRYTDIVKIKDEFDAPLKSGIIISKKNTPGGVVIYFQIRDKGLKLKFQRT